MYILSNKKKNTIAEQQIVGNKVLLYTIPLHRSFPTLHVMYKFTIHITKWQLHSW